MTTPLCLAVTLLLLQSQTEPPAPLEAPAPEQAAEQGSPRPLSRVILKDKQVLLGVVVHQDEQRVVLELAQGSRLELSAALVERVEAAENAELRADGEVWFQDPNRTRYLYAPSGMMLRQGEAYFSQKELFFSSFNYGATDHITLQAGSVLPGWAFDGGANFIGGIKVGGSVGERVHLAAGAQVGLVPGLLSGDTLGAGFLYGTGTYGTPDAHVSLGVATPFFVDRPERILTPHLVLAVSGNLRVSQRVALVTENWLVPTLVRSSSTFPMINSLAARLFGERWAVDVGLVLVPTSSEPTFFPLPWLDFSYNFG